MKRFFSMCFLFLFVLVGCTTTDLKSGCYYMVGDYEEHITPYVNLNFDDNGFVFGEGLILSYAEHGGFKIMGKRITATTQNTAFVFEIKNASLITLIDCGGYEPFVEYEGSEFAYHMDNGSFLS